MLSTFKYHINSLLEENHNFGSVIKGGYWLLLPEVLLFVGVLGLTLLAGGIASGSRLDSRNGGDEMGRLSVLILGILNIVLFTQLLVFFFINSDNNPLLICDKVYYLDQTFCVSIYSQLSKYTILMTIFPLIFYMRQASICRQFHSSSQLLILLFIGLFLMFISLSCSHLVLLLLSL